MGIYVAFLSPWFSKKLFARNSSLSEAKIREDFLLNSVIHYTVTGAEMDSILLNTISGVLIERLSEINL